MFARVNFVNGVEGDVEAGLAYFQETVIPALEAHAGFRGAAIFGGRDSEVITTLWDDESAAEASAEAVKPLRDEALRRLGGAGVEIELYDVPVFHRKQKPDRGAVVRLRRVESAPDRVDDAITAYRDSIVSELDQLDGFRSAVLLADRANGRLLSTTVWADDTAARASEQAGAALRAEVADRFGGTIGEPELYELLLTTVTV